MITRSKVGIFKPKVFLVEHSLPREPSTFLESSQDPNWKKALNSEYAALLHNHTWTVVKAPPNASIVGCKWVFKVKTNPDGTIARYKARLVAKGYSQIQDLITMKPSAQLLNMPSFEPFLHLLCQRAGVYDKFMLTMLF